jgi:hypothetical protein
MWLDLEVRIVAKRGSEPMNLRHRVVAKEMLRISMRHADMLSDRENANVEDVDHPRSCLDHRRRCERLFAESSLTGSKIWARSAAIDSNCCGTYIPEAPLIESQIASSCRQSACSASMLVPRVSSYEMNKMFGVPRHRPPCLVVNEGPFEHIDSTYHLFTDTAKSIRSTAELVTLAVHGA